MVASSSRTRVTHRLARLIVALAVAAPLAVTSPKQADAACSLVWTNVITATSAKPDTGTYWYRSTVKYQLRFDTCRLGVYDRVKVVSWTNQLYMYKSLFPFFVHTDLETAVLSNFGSLVYPGPIAYIDKTDITRTGNGYLTRAKVLGTVYVYDKDFAIFENYSLQNGLADEKFAFKFLTGQLYCWVAC
jgi:hypothetical protein